MENDEVVDAESVEVISLPTRDTLGNLQWRGRDGELIRLADMADSRLRNVALFLMDLGYQRCVCSNTVRANWLTALRMEWERRLRARRLNGGFLVKVR